MTEPVKDKPRISGPRYLITETDDRVWWRHSDQQPVYITPAYWWDR